MVVGLGIFFGCIGGEEFVIFLCDQIVDMVCQLVEQIWLVVKIFLFVRGEVVIIMSISVGVVFWSGENVVLLCDQVDQVFYVVKCDGCDCVRVYWFLIDINFVGDGLVLMVSLSNNNMVLCF